MVIRSELRKWIEAQPLDFQEELAGYPDWKVERIWMDSAVATSIGQSYQRTPEEENMTPDEFIAHLNAICAEQNAQPEG